MMKQTIALFRFLMLGIVNRRLFALLAILLLIAVLAGSFVGEVAIINSHRIATGLMADLLRYSLALLMLLLVITNVVDDYESSQFERLLTMPLARWQYVAAQSLVVASLSLLLAIPVALLFSLYGGVATGFYWATALWLELWLLGQLGLLAAISLERVTFAFFFALAVYLLAKLSGLISLMLIESVKLSEGSAASVTTEWIFQAILYVLPGLKAFADSDVFFVSHDLGLLLGQQFGTVSIYLLFLTAACLLDFYRKEFDR